MSGLINLKGDDFPAKHLPISKSFVEPRYVTIRMFDDMSDNYDAENPPDLKQFADIGYAIGMTIKTELPDWQVRYANALLLSYAHS